MSHARPIFAAPFVAVLACVFIAGAGGCDRQTAPTAGVPAADPNPHAPAAADAPQLKKLPTTQLTLAGTPFTLELAIDPKDQEQGLMHRTQMGEQEGMIFVFPDSRPRGFWMKNTLIPLDIAYLDANGVVLNIPQMIPRDLTPVPSRGPAKYAIELNAGTAARIGLKAGDRVELPASLR